MKQPNLWTCYPTAVAIATGIDMNLIMEAIGHDGSRELNVPGEWKKEAFVQSEMTIAMLRLGWALVSFAADHANQDDPPTRRTAYPSVKELVQLTDCQPTVFVIKKPGREHAIAKTVRNRVIDPSTGEDYQDDYPLVTVEIYIPIRKEGRR